MRLVNWEKNEGIRNKINKQINMAGIKTVARARLHKKLGRRGARRLDSPDAGLGASDAISNGGKIGELKALHHRI